MPVDAYFHRGRGERGKVGIRTSAEGKSSPSEIMKPYWFQWRSKMKLYLPLSYVRKEVFMFVMTEFVVYSHTGKYSGL